MKIFTRMLAVLAIGGWTGAANAALLDLSFSGQVDGSGAMVGGVSATVGSPFTLDVLIDDANAALGLYTVLGISYTTTVGTYTTVAASWAKSLLATSVGASISLGQQGGFFEDNPTTEHFGLSLSNFGPSSFDNPLSWTGAAITGDIIVRGINGFDSFDQLSGSVPLSGTLAVSVRNAAVPAPATLALFGLGLAGLGWSRRKKA